MKVSFFPSWEECEQRVQAGTANPVDQFIYDYEPANSIDALEFRDQFNAALEFVVEETINRLNEK